MARRRKIPFFTDEDVADLSGRPFSRQAINLIEFAILWSEVGPIQSWQPPAEKEASS